MKSIMASIFEAGFKLKEKSSEAETQAALEQTLAQGETPTPQPESLNTRFQASPQGGGFFYANEGTASRFTVFYLHGGAYRYDFSPFHWRFIKTLIEKTDAMVAAPAYRLVPFGTWKDAFDLIIPVYKNYAQQHPEKKIVLMGDSAGGGLSVAIAERLKQDGIRMPDEIILMSPWVDTTMENPVVRAYADADPWLHVPSLKVCSRWWAGDSDPHDPQVSPLFGDLSGLANVTVLTGTKEVLFPDTLRFYERIGREETNELHIADGMMHVYPLMPIPEAKAAHEIIFKKVTR